MTAQPDSVRLLYRLFLKLMVRGPLARWPTLRQAPNSPLRLAAGSLLFLAWGLFSFVFLRRSQGALIWYLHATTVILLPIYLAALGGDLFLDRDERLILSHWPISGRDWYRGKFLILAQQAGWSALALNLTGVVVGTIELGGREWFAPVHLLSVGFETVFCVSAVGIAYQWVPRLRPNRRVVWLGAIGGMAAFYGLTLAWAHSRGYRAAGYLFPPAWFVGLDEALLGGRTEAVPLGLEGIVAAATLLCLAWSGFLAADQVLPLEERPARNEKGHRRGSVAARLLRSRFANIGLRHSAERAAFAVTALYLLRSRDLRKRLLANLALLFALPFLLLLTGHGEGAFGRFTVAAVGSFLPLLAFLAIYCIETSNDWQAAQIFRSAPLLGPAELCAGARRAVLMICVGPTVVFYAVIVLVLRDAATALLLLPGAVLTPLVACLPNAIGRGLPLSMAPDSARAPAAQSSYVWILGVLMVALMATLAQDTGYFWVIIALEMAGTCWFYVGARRQIYSQRWAGNWGAGSLP